jgi:hypothetical protein
MIVIKFSEISHHDDWAMQVAATSLIHRVHITLSPLLFVLAADLLQSAEPELKVS